MVLKTKLSLGIGFLFLIILTLAGFCSYYVERLGQRADNILRDNYDSIVYSRNMVSALDDMRTSMTGALFNPSHARNGSDYYLHLFESGRQAFETNLKLENSNITEIHEKEYVESLNREYEMFGKLCLQMKAGSAGSLLYFNTFLPSYERVKQLVNGIYDLNMQAVIRKSQMAKQDSTRFITSMAIIGSLCLLLALAYFWYFPFYVSTTFSYLSDRINNMLKKLGIESDTRSNDEALVILHAIDLIENRFGVTGDKSSGPIEKEG
jgi:hypothetical protein